jgi:MYXO-CTERM domain-containing protein
VASVAPLLAIVLWRIYGGSLYVPELATVALGHMLNAGLTVSLAAGAASLTEHPSTAAIVTLAVTVGTWIINFVAAIHGGIWQLLAGYTPTAMVAEFQHGLIRLDVVLIALALITFGLALTAIWMQLGLAVRTRFAKSIGLAAITLVTISALTFATASWDVSESRENSFALADETALRSIRTPLRIEVHLAPEDPRRSDLEHRALSKLRRVMPRLQVQFISSTSTGLFEQTAPNYGEIWYDLGGRRAMSRITTAEGVLETIYDLAAVTPPPDDTESVFRGHPLATTPSGAAAVFYGAWPALVAAGAVFIRRRKT